ncbi:hypothetical protein [Leisingera caerulea]|uniref:hypothetical protein n=1 Tax=Leisingera caerulea TaxID=506591 RepID=UPI0021A6D9D8|nr:hypothetical protein [Leisingera caerulea]
MSLGYWGAAHRIRHHGHRLIAKCVSQILRRARQDQVGTKLRHPAHAGLVLVYRAVPVADPAASHDTLAGRRRIDAFASSHNFAHGIGTLGPREDEGAAAPGGVFRARFVKDAAGCGVLDGL